MSKNGCKIICKLEMLVYNNGDLLSEMIQFNIVHRSKICASKNGLKIIYK